LTAKKNEVKLDVEARARQGVKAVLEEVLEEEMTQHLKARHREFTPPGVVSAMATTHATSDLGGQDRAR
jgi:transposase-like protein